MNLRKFGKQTNLCNKEDNFYMRELYVDRFDQIYTQYNFKDNSWEKHYPPITFHCYPPVSAFCLVVCFWECGHTVNF